MEVEVIAEESGNDHLKHFQSKDNVEEVRANKEKTNFKANLPQRTNQNTLTPGAC